MAFAMLCNILGVLYVVPERSPHALALSIRGPPSYLLGPSMARRLFFFKTIAKILVYRFFIPSVFYSEKLGLENDCTCFTIVRFCCFIEIYKWNFVYFFTVLTYLIVLLFFYRDNFRALLLIMIHFYVLMPRILWCGTTNRVYAFPRSHFHHFM